MINTFSSMNHQVKSRTAGPHVQKVVDARQLKYQVQVYDKQAPEFGGNVELTKQIGHPRPLTCLLEPTSA